MKLKVSNITACLLTLCFFGFATTVSAQNGAKPKKSDKKMSNQNPNESPASIEEVKKIIIELERQYQEAVKNNDAKTIDRILADDFVLVTGKGKVLIKENFLKAARDGKTVYERQEDSEQTVRVWGDTAVITALLWAKGVSGDGKPFDYKLWFSDVYKRTPGGWRYVFAQAAQPLPNSP